MFRSRPSARSCSAWRAPSASWRCLANSARSVNTMVPPTVTLSASIRLENHSGSCGGRSSAIPVKPDARKTTTNAPYQRIPAPIPLKTRAPSGPRMPQMPTAPPGRNPPSAIIDRVGASMMSASWIRSSMSKSRVRANSRIETIEITA